MSKDPDDLPVCFDIELNCATGLLSVELSWPGNEYSIYEEAPRWTQKRISRADGIALRLLRVVDVRVDVGAYATARTYRQRAPSEWQPVEAGADPDF